MYTATLELVYVYYFLLNARFGCAALENALRLKRWFNYYSSILCQIKL